MKKILILIAILLFANLISTIWSANVRPANAQETKDTTLLNLFGGIKSVLGKGENLEVLVMPLGGQPFVVGKMNSRVSASVKDIGVDYVCFGNVRIGGDNTFQTGGTVLSDACYPVSSLAWGIAK